ncbi:L-rhamnose isomerase [Verrucomicrobiales bacterium]|nr:L-rhamnose isomerase [Verrucomicrobiales bacterium]
MNTEDRIHQALNDFQIETPSWGYADTGTRFGKFTQDGAAITIQDKLADAGQVHQLTGCCPQVAVHVLWDFNAETSPEDVGQMASTHNVRIGSINPNLFQDQCYKLGSLTHPDIEVRKQAIAHCVDSVQLGQTLDSRVATLWLADGTNYPGQDNIRARKQRLESALAEIHEQLSQDQILLVEYKPFEPAFYHTDIADWGMAWSYARKAGEQAKVLVDTGHHYAAQNIEQIVAWLLDEKMLGGFHFNDRRYADDDLTLGSIDPYQIFRIFHEIFAYANDHGAMPTIEYMIDQSHNLKPKIEAMIQTVMTAQELYAKASLVDHDALRGFQDRGQIVDAERALKQAYDTDVRPMIADWRKAHNLPEDPIIAFRESGYQEEAAADRKKRREELGINQTSSYA